MRRYAQLYTHKEQFFGLVITTLIVCVVGYSSLYWQYTALNEEAKLAATNHVDSIYSKINGIIGATSSLSTLYKVTTDVGSDELEQYTEDLVGVSESIATIGRFDRIQNDDVSEFGNLMSERGIYRFEIKSLNSDGSVSPSTNRNEYNAVVNVNPFTPSSARLIGVDLSNEELLGSRLLAAVQANNSVLSEYPIGWPKKGNVLLILPTYSGRYTPDTIASRMLQNDGGYFIELSFQHFVTNSDSISSQVSLPGEVLSKPPSLGKNYRAFTGIFSGHRTHLTPLIGNTPIDIILSSPDGVPVKALYKGAVLIASAVLILIIALLLITKTRLSEVRKKKAQLSLNNERKTALTTLEALNDSVFTVSTTGHITYVNPAAESMVGLPAEQLIGNTIKDSIPFASSEGSLRGLKDLERKLLESEPTHLKEMELSGNTTAKQVDCTFTPFDESDSTDGGVVVMRDVGKERALNRKLEHLATHDSLTGLVNRYFFEIKLDEMVKGARDRGESHAVCYIDLDQFKIVNDTCGHSAGDKLLIQVANSLTDNCRATDVLARLGGDEFGLLIRHCSEAECEQIARRLHEVFQSFYFIFGEHKFSIRACFGFVPVSKKYEDVTDVLAAADLACYSAKDKGRNELHIFRIEGEETSLLKGEMLLLPKLQHALAVDRFVLFVQPIAEIHPDGTYTTTKYEFLLRMLDDDGSLITPFRLISAAERYDLMKEVDRWVISKAFQDVADMYEIMGDQMPMFSINLSGQSVTDGDIVGFILSKVSQSGVPCQKICFEITETSAIGDLSRAMLLLDFLHGLGCKLALDDFGSGECSFGYLKKLPVDYLKVDGQFVQDVDSCEVHQEVLRFVQRVAKLLDMKTVAEFVENENVLEFLGEMGIDYAQGYHIGKPFPVEQLIASARAKNVA